MDAEEFGSTILRMILKYLDGSQGEFSSASNAALEQRIFIFFFFKICSVLCWCVVMLQTQYAIIETSSAPKRALMRIVSER